VTGVVEVGREDKARGVNSCPEGRSRVFFFSFSSFLPGYRMGVRLSYFRSGVNNFCMCALSWDLGRYGRSNC